MAVLGLAAGLGVGLGLARRAWWNGYAAGYSDCRRDQLSRLRRAVVRSPNHQAGRK